MAVPLKVLERISETMPHWYAEFLSYRTQLRHWIDAETIPNPEGEIVWDMGCGWGGFTLGFLTEGAVQVIGTDTFLDESHLPHALFEIEAIRLIQGDTIGLIPTIFDGHAAPPSLIFMHLVSEHITDLAGLLRAIRSHCNSATKVFIHHDNYYQPAGHHDHGFVSLQPEKYAIESRAVACWDDPRKCAASEAHRNLLRVERSWQWSAASEATRDPPQCVKCNYRIRAQPWAHLLAADQFTTVWPEPFFRTALNKITPFQLRQHLVESGFEILSDVGSMLNNKVVGCLSERFAEVDLRTFTVTIVAKAR